jgi:prepilin-type N-terminal cleavage/methylation domain-containing protein
MTARSRRRGFTLLEVLLATAILAMLAAVCYPSLKSSYGHYKLTGGIDSVRAAWAMARAHAVEEGRPYRFSVEPNGSRFRVAPDQSDYWSGSAPGDDSKGKGMVLEKALPGGVRFSVNGQPAGDVPEDRSPPGSEDKATFSGVQWKTAVVFLPDGTAKDDLDILFEVQGARATNVHLRGLTAAVTVKPVDK